MKTKQDLGVPILVRFFFDPPDITSQYNLTHNDVIPTTTRVWQTVPVIVLVGSQ